MSMQRKTIMITSQTEDCVKAYANAGHYDNDNEFSAIWCARNKPGSKQGTSNKNTPITATQPTITSPTE